MSTEETKVYYEDGTTLLTTVSVGKPFVVLDGLAYQSGPDQKIRLAVVEARRLAAALLEHAEVLERREQAGWRS